MENKNEDYDFFDELEDNKDESPREKSSEGDACFMHFVPSADDEEDPLNKTHKVRSFNMDLLTLECLTNKKAYNKIVSKNEPETYKMRKEFEMKKMLNRSRIKEITDTLLCAEDEKESEDNAPNKDVLDSFNEYIKNVISFIEYEHRISMDYKPNYDYDGSGIKNRYDVPYISGGRNMFMKRGGGGAK